MFEKPELLNLFQLNFGKFQCTVRNAKKIVELFFIYMWRIGEFKI